MFLYMTPIAGQGPAWASLSPQQFSTRVFRTREFLQEVPIRATGSAFCGATGHLQACSKEEQKLVPFLYKAGFQGNGILAVQGHPGSSPAIPSPQMTGRPPPPPRAGMPPWSPGCPLTGQQCSNRQQPLLDAFFCTVLAFQSHYDRVALPCASKHLSSANLVALNVS